MDKKTKKILKQSFSPPPTQYKEQFINSISYPKAIFYELLISQIGFIRKRVWLLSMLCVCSAFFYTQLATIPENIIAGVSAILPFLSLCGISEIYKSITFNMAELELACKYNLSKITLARIGIAGTACFTALAFIVAIASKSDYGMLRNTIYISVPFLLSSYLSLLIILKFRSKETLYVCATMSGAVSAFMMILGGSYRVIYNIDFTHIWVAILVLLIGLILYSLIQFIKSQEELQWSLV